MFAHCTNPPEFPIPNGASLP